MSSKPGTPNSLKGNRRHLSRSSGVFGVLPQSPKIHYPIDPENLPLESSLNTEKFEQLSDSLEELDSNMSNLQQINQAVSSGFNESFAAFLYGLSMTMWCVDFPGTPSKSQWERLNTSKEIDERIRNLQDKITTIKRDNQELNIKLLNTTTPIRTPRPESSDHRLRLKPTNDINKRPASKLDSDDTYTTNDGSFVTEPKTKPGPNLNQPPRYMRGLFDSTPKQTPQSRITKRPVKKPPSIKNRPPFR